MLVPVNVDEDGLKMKLSDWQMSNIKRAEKGKFNYSGGKNSWSSRVYHPLTSMRGALRDHVFLVAGYRHQYDIRAASPRCWRRWRVPTGLSTLFLRCLGP